MKLPFYIPDDELSFRIGKLICLFESITSISKGEIYLDIQKIGQLEFLIKHPIVLNKILNDKKKKSVELYNSEMYSIEALFLNRAEIFDFKKIDVLLKVLLSNDFITASILSDNQIYYKISNQGIQIATKLQSEYFQRLRMFIKEMKPLVSLKSSSIEKLIQSHLIHVKKN